MKLSGVRPFVYPIHDSRAGLYCGFAAVGPAAGDIDRLLHGRRSAATAHRATARRAAANADSATLSADVGR